MQSEEIDWIKLSDLVSLISNKAYKFAQYHYLITSLNNQIHFESLQEYQEKYFPLFQNENYCGFQKEMEFQIKKLQTSSSLPLKYRVMIDQDFEANSHRGIKLKVIKPINEQINMINTWKYQNYVQYLSFKNSINFIGGLYKKKQNGDIYSTLCIFSQRDDEKFIILPYKKEIFRNLIYYQQQHQNNGIYIQRRQFIINFIPLSSPKVYQNEINSLFKLQNCSFDNLILQPSNQLNNIQPTQYCRQIKQIFLNQKSNTNFTQYFDSSQLDAIENAIDYTKQFTLIEGPPGTGKTQTILGILSIFQSLLKESRNENTQKDVILILGKSNGIVNDLVRKINKSIETQNSIIYCSDEQPNILKALRFGRPDLCENDISRYSLEIRSQRKFFKQFETEVKNIFSRFVTIEISQSLRSESIQDFNSFLKDIDEQNNNNTNEIQISLVQLMKYIEHLNFRTRNINILKAYGHVYKDLHQIYKTNQNKYLKIEQDFIQYRHVLASTLNSCCNKKLQKALQNLNLRMCIIDEAPTALEPSQLIPFIGYNNIDKVVLLGDTMQLGPIVISKESENRHLNRSLFERMLGCLQQQKLTKQYRQMPNLAEITSKIFYSNTLRNNRISMQIPNYILNRIHYQRNSIFFNTPQGTEEFKDSSFRNNLECQGIIQLVKYLLSQEIRQMNKIISIISPYSRQKELLRFQFKLENLLNYVEIDTVDSFQGKENEIVILSLVRSNDSIGFLYDERRANVAFSRAQYCQYVFGSQQTFNQSNHNFWGKLITLYENQSLIIDYDEESLRDPNFFEQKLK